MTEKDWMDEERVAITGYPRTGKTTLGGERARSTDDVAHLGWSEASREVSGWFDAGGPLWVEGVAVPRALRKWLRRNPEGRPVDVVVWLSSPRVPLSNQQRAMGRGTHTVMAEIVDELEARGVRVMGFTKRQPDPPKEHDGGTSAFFRVGGYR